MTPLKLVLGQKTTYNASLVAIAQSNRVGYTYTFTLTTGARTKHVRLVRGRYGRATPSLGVRDERGSRGSEGGDYEGREDNKALHCGIGLDLSVDLKAAVCVSFDL